MMILHLLIYIIYAGRKAFDVRLVNAYKQQYNFDGTIIRGKEKGCLVYRLPLRMTMASLFAQLYLRQSAFEFLRLLKFFTWEMHRCEFDVWAVLPYLTIPALLSGTPLFAMIVPIFV